MKSRFRALVILLSLSLVIFSGLAAGGSYVAAEDEPLPCDPPPTRWCELRGGTFNFITCRCEFP